ncbi:BPTI/Kunitz domain-containing protein 4-like isoform X1 [Haliotis cracherodii]|uniref:BPTI/Kunitz domain-containing protein 4-like isoform X1 n=1 Tax=Haliotis cracherodii TaxID=6455 RepID=UPI0039EC0348
MGRLSRCLLLGLTLIVCSAVTHVQGKSMSPSWECGPPCEIPCECGLQTDRRGCPICTCKPCDVPTACPEIGCLQEKKCRFGYKTINGCPTCECNRPYNCPYYRPCQKWLNCPAGLVEINGCPTCMCKPTMKTTPRPDFCLTCCGPPPCCNYCGLEKLLAK